MIYVNTSNTSIILCYRYTLNIRQLNPDIAVPIDFLYNCFVDTANSKRILLIKRSDKAIYASYYGDADDYFIRELNCATS
ncbi:unnamed protein product [Rotaria sp. Silwood1]|nr:unnamed protein product [Rotaria sp. Silwood1]